jgi:hypothetical protein
MKSFRSFLVEVWHSSFKTDRNKKQIVDVHKNPNKKELTGITGYNETRCLIGKDSVYAWHPEHALHAEAHKHLGQKEELVPAMMNHKHKYVDLYGSPPDEHQGTAREFVDNHPYFKKAGYSHIDHYYQKSVKKPPEDFVG